MEKNISVNKFTNITLVKKGLSNKNGKSIFGGNGDLGNSESTLLIADVNYLKRKGRQTDTHKTNQPTVEIDTITLETLIENHNINPSDISLIKMDIEGGEIIVVPHLQNFLQIHKPVFYISLHYCFLKEDDIELIVDILFNIYKKCFYFTENGEKILINKHEVIKKKKNSLVFE